MAVLEARLFAVGLLRPGVRCLLWLMEARGLANCSEGLGGPDPVDESEGFVRAGLAQSPSIKVRALPMEVRGWGQAGPGPVDKSEGLGGLPGRLNPQGVPAKPP